MPSDLRTRIALVVAAMLVFTNALTAGIFNERFHDALEDHAVVGIHHDADVVGGPLQRLALVLRRDAEIVAGTRPAEGVGRAFVAGGVDPEDGSTYEQWRERLETIFESVMRGQPQYDQLRYLALTEGAPELIRVDRHGAGGVLRRVARGIGVPPERAPSLFRMFAREHGREVPGVGMGLAHCRKIVEQHGGTIGFVDREVGAKVTFYLPDA